MLLLELFNLHSSLLLLPDDHIAHIQPPTFREYLEDFLYYLRKTAPYTSPWYPSALHLFLVLETLCFSFLIGAGTGHFRIAAVYLPVKLVAILFAVLSFPYVNYVIWVLFVLIYPVELVSMFVASLWFFNRKTISQIDPETWTTFGWTMEEEYVETEDGWEIVLTKKLAYMGATRPTGDFLAVVFTSLYAYIKFNFLIGHAFKKFLKSLQYSEYMMRPTINKVYNQEFAFLERYPTSDKLKKNYKVFIKRNPILREAHRRSAAYDARPENGTWSLEQEENFWEGLVFPLRSWGVKMPWMHRRDRFLKIIRARFAPQQGPYEWVPNETLRPVKEDTRRERVITYINTYWLKKKEPDYKLHVRAISTKSDYPDWELYYNLERNFKSLRGLSGRIISTINDNMFASTAEAFLSPLHSKRRYRPIKVRWRYTPDRVSPVTKQTDVRTIELGGWGQSVHSEFELTTMVNNTPGFTYFRRRRNYYIYDDYTYALGRWRVMKRKFYMQHHATAPRVREFTPADRFVVPNAWERKFTSPGPRTGYLNFNFEQFVPLMELDSISNLRYGLLFILALSSLTVYSIILAGWSSNSKYAFLGALRSAAQMISYEVSISLALLPVILLSGSLNLTAIVYGQIGTVWYLFPLFPIGLVFLVSMLAETNRTPFDLPEAEAELVAGYNVDYSSLPFAMFFLGEYSNMILISVLFCLLFLGGWDGALLPLQEPYVLTMKAAVVWIFFVIVRATLPRYRYDQLMDIGWKAFLPFAGSFLVLTIGLVVFLDVAPVVEEVALEDLYGVPETRFDGMLGTFNAGLDPITTTCSIDTSRLPPHSRIPHPRIPDYPYQPQIFICPNYKSKPPLARNPLIARQPKLDLPAVNLFNYTRRPTNAKNNPLSNLLSNHLLSYPTPSSLTYNWSFGSLAGLFFAIQLVTGIFLAMHYTPHIEWAFQSVEHIMTDVTGGYLFRYLHANGASAIFILIYAHMARGLYYQSYLTRSTLWATGVLIFLLMMATAFIGYVLPWGQMSFWGATVITSLVTAIPLVGEDIAYWIWGGFSIGNATLNRFFSLHFLLPFVILAVILFLHLLVLHEDGSTDPFTLGWTPSKIPFHPYYTLKDTFALFVALVLFGLLVFYVPNMLGHSDNFIPANPLVTPAHIVPEWYFTPYYAILRACPDKIGGALGMFAAIIILLFIRKIIEVVDSCRVSIGVFSDLHKIAAGVFFANFMNLVYLGSSPAAAPYVISSKVSTGIYFGYFLLLLPLLAYATKKTLEGGEKKENTEGAATPSNEQQSIPRSHPGQDRYTPFDDFQPNLALITISALPPYRIREGRDDEKAAPSRLFQIELKSPVRVSLFTLLAQGSIWLCSTG